MNLSILGTAFFYVCAISAVAGALATILAKNPIRGAMGLLYMILNIAGLFLALHAQFLAAVQLIVYAGAIVVLFLFVIMLLGPSAATPTDQRGRIPRVMGAGLFAAVGLGGLALLIASAPKVKGELLQSPPPDFGSIDAFGRILFSHGLVPFELSSALLMVAIIGAVAVARGRHTSDHKTDRPHEASPASSLEHARTVGPDPNAPRTLGALEKETHS
jgi:NADH-quinone oxidoreductase subunit J